MLKLKKISKSRYFVLIVALGFVFIVFGAVLYLVFLYFIQPQHTIVYSQSVDESKADNVYICSYIPVERRTTLNCIDILDSLDIKNAFLEKTRIWYWGSEDTTLYRQNKNLIIQFARTPLDSLLLWRDAIKVMWDDNPMDNLHRQSVYVFKHKNLKDTLMIKASLVQDTVTFILVKDKLEPDSSGRESHNSLSSTPKHFTRNDTATYIFKREELLTLR